MLIYLIILLIPLLAGFDYEARSAARQLQWVFFGIVMIIFSGLRYEVGPDWPGYTNIYEISRGKTFDDILTSAEPGFFLLNIFSELLGFGLQGVIFFSAVIFLFGCFAYARVTANRWIALAVVMPYLIFIVSMSGIRQAAAIGIGMLMFSRWHQSSMLWKLSLIAVAVSFHTSAIVYVLFIILGLKKRLLLRLLGAGALSLTVVFGLDTTDTIDRYRNVYVEDNLLSGGAFAHVMLIAVPSALYVLFRHRIAACGRADENVLIASVATLALFPLLAVSSTGVDRLTLYFSFVQMWAYPAIICSEIVSRAAAMLAITALVLAVFSVYFFFGTHASAYIPYRNVLFL